MLNPLYNILSENSENQLNPVIIRVRKPYKNENAPHLSFPPLLSQG